MAFSVNLEGGPAENGDDSHDQSLDEYGLYQGVFWQVRKFKDFVQHFAPKSDFPVGSSTLHKCSSTPEQGSTLKLGIYTPLAYTERGADILSICFGDCLFQVQEYLRDRDRSVGLPRIWSRAAVRDHPLHQSKLVSISKYAFLFSLYLLRRAVTYSMNPTCQVCRDICSPPIAMFVSKPGCSMMDAPAATRRGVDDRRGENSRGTTIPWLDDGVVPDPLFIFNRELPTIYVDPTRLEYYHSLGFVAGLAVRSRVPLPLPRLAPRWWMLVAEEEHASAGSVSNDMAATARIVTATATRSGSSENRAASSSVSEESRRPTSSTVDGVLASLGRLQEGSTALPERLYEILADARFVGPLSNRQIVELSPGGET